MKFICLLISVYIFYLVSLPCKDGASCTNDRHVDQTSGHDHSGDQDHADGCSAFCICACCSVTVVLNDFHYQSTPDIKPIHIDFLLKEGKSEKYFSPFFQPPKAEVLS